MSSHFHLHLTDALKRCAFASILLGLRATGWSDSGVDHWLVVANDQSISYTSGKMAVLDMPRKGSLTVVDIGSRPRLARSIQQVPTSVIGPPTSIALHPTRPQTLVVSAMRTQKTDGTIQHVPDDRVSLVWLGAGSGREIIETIAAGRQPSSMSKLARNIKRSIRSTSVVAPKPQCSRATADTCWSRGQVNRESRFTCVSEVDSSRRERNGMWTVNPSPPHGDKIQGAFGALYWPGRGWCTLRASFQTRATFHTLKRRTPHRRKIRTMRRALVRATFSFEVISGKGLGKEARLCFAGHATMENGKTVAGCVCSSSYTRLSMHPTMAARGHALESCSPRDVLWLIACCVDAAKHPPVSSLHSDICRLICPKTPFCLPFCSCLCLFLPVLTV